MTKRFRPWDPKQKWLLPPEITEFIREGHPAHFVRDLVVEELDLAAILDSYVEDKGYPPFHPAMMVALLLYAYTQGVFSSRKIAKACIERMDFAAVTGFQKPGGQGRVAVGLHRPQPSETGEGRFLKPGAPGPGLQRPYVGLSVTLPTPTGTSALRFSGHGLTWSDAGAEGRSMPRKTTLATVWDTDQYVDGLLEPILFVQVLTG
jgi:hypothetical protein